MRTRWQYLGGLVLFALGFGHTAPASAADLLDLRNRSENTSYEVGFCARDSDRSSGLPGHAFVVFSEVPTTGERKFLAVGHSPAGKQLGTALGAPVSGFLEEETYTAATQTCLRVLVNSDQYQAAYQMTRPVLERIGLLPPSNDRPVVMTYELLEADCVSFAASVAETLDLTVPDRSGLENLPIRFVQALKDQN